MVVSAQKRTERWVQGMLSSPLIECPVCGGKTMAYSQCQYCKAKWTKEQLEYRAERRKDIHQ